MERKVGNTLESMQPEITRRVSLDVTIPIGETLQTMADEAKEDAKQNEIGFEVSELQDKLI